MSQSHGTLFTGRNSLGKIGSVGRDVGPVVEEVSPGGGGGGETLGGGQVPSKTWCPKKVRSETDGRTELGRVGDSSD